jgi:hypothetical protein
MATQSRCAASGSGYKFEEGRGFLLGNGEEAERSALRPAHALLPASDARHASAEVARKIGLAQAKGRAGGASCVLLATACFRKHTAETFG